MPLNIDDTANSGFKYEMKVTDLEVATIRGHEKVVWLVRWELTGEIQECEVCGKSHSATHVGATQVLYRDPVGFIDPQGRFDVDHAVPFEDLTEEMIIEWVNAELLDVREDGSTYAGHGALMPFQEIQKAINTIHITKASPMLHDPLDLPWQT